MAVAAQVTARGGGRRFRRRLAVTAILAGLVLVGLVGRLYVLQVRRGEELAHKGRRNFVQSLVIAHDRGIIYDRRGNILADNRPSLDVQITPAFVGRDERGRATCRSLGVILRLDDGEQERLWEQVRAARGLAAFQPQVVRRDLTPLEVEAIEAQRSIFALDGVDIAEGRKRNYPHGQLAAHVLGYTNSIDAATLAEVRTRGNPAGYHLSDLVGREGAERSYEAELRGADGVEKVVVDAKGRRQGGAWVAALLADGGRREPTPGHNVHLTIDLKLQQVAEASLAHYGQAGSIVALDPHTGAIRALVSLPAYDVNAVSGLTAKQMKARLDADPLRPWINRAIQGQYAPGSTFKPVTALAALAARPAGDEAVFCPGFWRLGRHSWRCWRDGGHGAIDLRQAMKVSCDTFFYALGHRLGIDPVAEMGRLLGLGGRTGIALGGEQPGLMPDEAFHRRIDRATGGYQRGMAVNTAIGQGATLVTPLQLAVAYAAIAVGRGPLRPQLVERISSADFRVATWAEGRGSNLAPQWAVGGDQPQVTWAMDTSVRAPLPIRAAALAPVRRGLEAVTSEPGGTGYRQRSRQVAMAGKTGTAQVVRLGRERLRQWDVGYEERDHAWFVAYAPPDQPELVVVVLNEHGGHGSTHAEPVAVAVIDAYLGSQAQARWEGAP